MTVAQWERTGGPGLTTTRLVLVRHGQSFSNVEHRLCGLPPGPALTPLGERQADRAARIVLATGEEPTVLLTSPLRRTRETARALSVRTGLEPEIVDDLRELQFGQWEGITRAEMLEDPHWQRWSRDPENFPPPGGERLSEAGARVARTLGEAARAHAGGSIAAFSHHDPMLAFYVQVTGGSWADYPNLAIPNTCILTFEYDGEAWTYLGVDRRAAIKSVEADGEITA
jgi:broad specificity phosphatase PhoE